MNLGASGLKASPCGEVYQAYTAWCAQNGYHPLNASNFGKEVKRAFPNVQRNNVRYGQKQVWVYCGLGLKEGVQVVAAIAAGKS
jgi:phage/plasmid-associated DNA primase